MALKEWFCFHCQKKTTYFQNISYLKYKNHLLWESLTRLVTSQFHKRKLCLSHYAWRRKHSILQKWFYPIMLKQPSDSFLTTQIIFPMVISLCTINRERSHQSFETECFFQLVPRGFSDLVNWNQTTLVSKIDVRQGINLGPGKFG